MPSLKDKRQQVLNDLGGGEGRGKARMEEEVEEKEAREGGRCGMQEEEAKD